MVCRWTLIREFEHAELGQRRKSCVHDLDVGVIPFLAPDSARNPQGPRARWCWSQGHRTSLRLGRAPVPIAEMSRSADLPEE